MDGGAEGTQQPHLILAHKLFLLTHPDVQDIEKVQLKSDVLDSIKSDGMAPLYETLAASSVLELDQSLLDSMRASNEEELKKLDEKIADAEENLGESEVREAHLAKALYFIRISDKEKALEQLKLTEGKTVAVGQKMDLVFYTLQLAFFYMDFDLVSKSIDKAKKLFEEGGDWERKNRLKVYEGLYCMSTRNFKKAASLFLDSISTFTTYEIFPYETFIFYTVLTSIITLDRVSLKQKVVDAPEILTVLGKIPFLSEFLNSLYECQYKAFFSAFAGMAEQIKFDRYLNPHFRFYMREVRTVVYSQFLESYKSVTVDAMANAFGVSVDFIDQELSRFIAAGKLHCKIDKVAGVLETNRPDAKNALYQATIKQGDFLLNRIQKLSRVIDLTEQDRSQIKFWDHHINYLCLCEKMHAIDFKEIQEKLSDGFRPWQRSFQFWARASDIYTGYKVFQLRVSFVKDVKKQEEMWETQHELAAHKIYAMCSDLGGFFLKVAQILGKPDLAPAAWVRKLVTLCDQAPATPFDSIRLVLEKELGKSIDEVFESFDDKPLGSASIAQVHRARVKGDKRDVVVKVQHPGVEKLMMTDIRNLQIFALYMQKTDIKFDLFSITKEMEKQIGYEFDFKREANAMEKIRRFLYDNNWKSPVLVPRVLPQLVTRRVLVMDYINGIPILRLGDEMAKRGINPRGRMAEAAKLNILSSLSKAYGQMILKSGFFHADPHPGNILICKVTFAKCENEQQELLQLAKTMFDTKMPPGVSVLQPFSEDSSIKKISVEGFPEELFSVLRTVILLRGLSVGIGLNYSCAQQWKPIAEEALLASGRHSPETIISLWEACAVVTQIFSVVVRFILVE
ncbi:hypothetical protein HID58_030100 [Brassica napus]|uniref:PCI domain-containing protein n=4 Tax=Brassica TaxID=3705 RepID=A0ABQ8CEY3_BRANA|nr:hypothetical protein HID58_030100 [Brassica napus]